MLRLFAQARNIEAFGPLGSLASLALPDGLGHYPGWHINVRVFDTERRYRQLTEGE